LDLYEILHAIILISISFRISTQLYYLAKFKKVNLFTAVIMKQ
jgi:hypothetical protein